MKGDITYPSNNIFRIQIIVLIKLLLGDGRENGFERPLLRGVMVRGARLRYQCIGNRSHALEWTRYGRGGEVFRWEYDIASEWRASSTACHGGAARFYFRSD